MGPLSLDLIHLWAQSENRDPTICIFKSFLQFGHSKLWLTPPKEFKNLNYEPLKKKKKKKKLPNELMAFTKKNEG